MMHVEATSLKYSLCNVATVLTAGILALVGAVPGHSAESVSTPAGPDGIAQIAYVPAKVPAPVVILLSGQSGPKNYEPIGAEFARQGYYAVLVDGKDILTRAQDGAGNLKKTIARGQSSPHAVPGKVAVIGFSQGGGGAIFHAAAMPELVSVVVAYYPATSWSQNLSGLVKRFRVPVLILAGELDTYNNNCCPVAHMRAIEAAAKENASPFELVVYPQAAHHFNVPGPTYRKDDATDAWRRTTEKLGQYLPLQK